MTPNFSVYDMERTTMTQARPAAPAPQKKAGKKGASTSPTSPTSPRRRGGGRGGGERGQSTDLQRTLDDAVRDIIPFTDALGITHNFVEQGNLEVLMKALDVRYGKRGGSVIDTRLILMEMILESYYSEFELDPSVKEVLDAQLGSTFLNVQNTSHDNTACVMRATRTTNSNNDNNNGRSARIQVNNARPGNGNAPSISPSKCNPENMIETFNAVVGEFLYSYASNDPEAGEFDDLEENLKTVSGVLHSMTSDPALQDGQTGGTGNEMSKFWKKLKKPATKIANACGVLVGSISRVTSKTPGLRDVTELGVATTLKGVIAGVARYVESDDNGQKDMDRLSRVATGQILDGVTYEQMYWFLMYIKKCIAAMEDGSGSKIDLIRAWNEVESYEIDASVFQGQVSNGQVQVELARLQAEERAEERAAKAGGGGGRKAAAPSRSTPRPASSISARAPPPLPRKGRTSSRPSRKI